MNAHEMSDPSPNKSGAFEHTELTTPGSHIQGTRDQTGHQLSRWANGWLFIQAAIIGLSFGLYGYDNNFTAPLAALPLFIVKYQGAGLAFTARNLNLIISVPLVGAAAGTFVAAPLMKHIGRKKTFLLAYFFLCTPGSILQVFAPNIGALVAGRFWNCKNSPLSILYCLSAYPFEDLGVSVLTTTAPLYLSELVPAPLRARFVGFCVAGASATGIVGTSVVWSTEKFGDKRQFVIPLAIQAALPFAFGCLTMLCPESPLWDLQHDRRNRARSTLMRLRNQSAAAVEAEILSLEAVMHETTALRSQIRFWQILSRSNLTRTLTAGAILSLSQVGGQILVLSYSTIILVQSGVADPFQVTVIISCLTFLGTIVGPVLIDKAGRRPVAGVGFSILFVLNMAAGALAAAGLQTSGQRLGLAAVFIVFAFFNAVSFLSLGFLLPTEVARPSLREPTMAWALFWSYTTAIITTFAVPQIISPEAGNLGAKAAFIFGGCTLLTLVWAYFYIPETKARTVAEIDEMYAIELPMRKWRGYEVQTLNPGVQAAAGKQSTAGSV